MPGEQHPFDLPRDDTQPGVGDQGTPQGDTQVSNPPNDPDKDLRSTVESLKPLTIFAEALKDPAVQQRVINAFTGAGAPPVDSSVPKGPTLADQEAEIRTRYATQKKQALEAGDLNAALDLAATEGAEIGDLRSTARFQAAANPVVAMTARNTIDNWCVTKRQTSQLFAKLEGKFRAFVEQTSPATLSNLAQNGGLVQALEIGWQRIAAETYESGYNKNYPIEQQRPNPPSYTMGGGGGTLPSPDTPKEDDKDDDEFRKWAQEKGINFALDGSGALTGEVK